jgi:TM2 domain-containing membrane protein YozV
MTWKLMVGFFGTHRFYVGRRISAWVMLICGTVGLVCAPFVPRAWRDYFDGIYLFGENSLFFPTDIMFLVAFCMWAYDAAGVVLGYFAYPIRLGETTTTGKAQQEFQRKVKGKADDGAKK